jgi:Xaa-Pro aminopeptidase
LSAWFRKKPVRDLAFKNGGALKALPKGLNMSKPNKNLTLVNGVPTPTAVEYAERRDKVFATMEAHSALIFVAAPELLRNGDDNTFDYRQSSDMLYLSGFPEAHSVLVLKKGARGNRAVLFVSPKDEAAKLWHGERVGVEDAVAVYGADSAYGISTLVGNLGKLLRGVHQVGFSKSTGNGRDVVLEDKIAAVLRKAGLKANKSGRELLDQARVVKSETELAIMSRAATIAASAHTRAMRVCMPGLRESHLKAEIEHHFTFHGNNAPSYGTIVAGGVNGLCLHHPADNSLLADGDMVLIDAGCEVSGYASDITRTLPVNGQFSEAQRAIYELVLASQSAAIAAVKPGVTMEDLDKACSAVLEAGLLALGFPMGKKSEATISLREVLPHGLGHWLGLDVHDVGPNIWQTKLAPGMVITIEPGLYLAVDDKRIPEAYRGIAVRIEDDVEVREDGCFVLTYEVVKTVAEVEAVMAGL